MRRILIGAVFCGIAGAQDAGNRITVPVSDPSRPKMVSGSLNNGCFTVEGYDGKEVIAELVNRQGERARPERVPRGAEGLKRITPNGIGLRIEEENNTVSIHSADGRGQDVLLRVPMDTSLKLNCLDGGEINVSRVNGDLDLQNLNGAVVATNVSGTVLAHSMNGRVVVSMDRVTPDKPMSFTSMNGNVDVTLPADTRATVRMKSDHGDIYSDFDVKLTASDAPVVEDARSKGGKYQVRVDSTTTGTINGGGPEFAFRIFNGNIYIRKKK